MKKEEICKRDRGEEKVEEYCRLMGEFLEDTVPRPYQISVLGSMFGHFLTKVQDKEAKKEILSAFLFMLEETHGPLTGVPMEKK